MTIAKGTKIGTCVPAASLIHQVTATTDEAGKYEELVSAASDSLNNRQKKKLTELLQRYRSIFIPANGKTGRTNIVSHKIDTGDTRPIRQPARRLPRAKREIAEKIIQDMEQDGVIEPFLGFTSGTSEEERWKHSFLRGLSPIEQRDEEGQLSFASN